MDTKICETCGDVYPRPVPLGQKQWDARRFCSRKCFGVHSAERQRRLADKPCALCGKLFRPGSPGVKYCSWDCAKQRPRPRGADHPSWKGGRTVDPTGYVRVLIPPDHPMAAMRMAHGYIQEHRLVMAEKLGRPLLASETVHHKNGDRADNRPENLELFSGRHGKGATHAHCATCTCFE